MQGLGDIWVGDVARAWRALRPEEESERRLIAEVLGFSYVERPVEPVNPVVVHRPPPSTASAGSRERYDPTSDHDIGEAGVQPRTDGPIALPVKMVSTSPQQRASTMPAWVTVNESLAPEKESHLAFRPAAIPLLVPLWTRAIVGAIAANRIEAGPIDFDRVVDAVCRVRPILRLPRRLVWTVRDGAQILVDRGQSMMPFARDAASLAESIRAIAGRDRTALFRFRDCPGRGLDSRERTPPPHRPPAPGTPVIVISDLGLARGSAMRGGATESEWLAFAALIRRAGCPLIAFVPGGPSRWTAGLRRAFQLIAWDRSTTVGSARRVAKGEKP